MPDRYAVYRLYDKRGGLLYVGSTKRLMARLEQHAAVQPWWPGVASVHVDGPYPDEQAVRAHEQAAIDAGAPLHNRCRASGQMGKRNVRIADDLWAAAKATARDNGETVNAAIRHFLADYAA